MPSSAGLSRDTNKVRAVTDLSVFKTIKDIRSFMQLGSYIRRFVHNIASIAPTLTAILRKNGVLYWSLNCSPSLSQLKAVFTSPPVLNHFIPDAPVAIHTDASEMVLRGSSSTVRKGPHGTLRGLWMLYIKESGAKLYNVRERFLGDCLACGKVATLPVWQTS